MAATERPNKKKGKKPVGRPSKYSKELADKICAEISTSSLGLHSICKRIRISYVMVFSWLGQPGKEYFTNRYAHAREAQADFLADEIVEISNTPKEGFRTTTKPNPKGRGTIKETISGDMIEHRRLQVDARKWKASKLAPKKYGDKVDITSDNKALSIIVTTVDDETKKAVEDLK